MTEAEKRVRRMANDAERRNSGSVCVSTNDLTAVLDELARRAKK